MLLCTKCKIEKHEDSFTHAANASARGFKHYWCRDCNRQQYMENKERHRAQCRANSIKRRYGLTVVEYDSMIAKGCSICGEAEKRIVVDHCHATNAIRAPLCDQCNQGLGNFKDDPSILRQAAVYLEEHMLSTQET